MKIYREGLPNAMPGGDQSKEFPVLVKRQTA